MSYNLTKLVEELLNKATETEEPNRVIWRKQLELDIVKLRKDSENISDFLDNENYDKINTESSTIVFELKDYEKLVDHT